MLLSIYIIWNLSYIFIGEAYNHHPFKPTLTISLHHNNPFKINLLTNNYSSKNNDTYSNINENNKSSSNYALFPPLSVTTRPVPIEKGGHIEKLKELYDKGLSTAINYFQAWPSNETKIVDLFATTFEPKAAIVPGQRTYLTIPAEERSRIATSFEQHNAAVIFIGWVEANQFSNAEPSPSNPSPMNLIGYSAVAAVDDIKLLDKNGEIGIEIIGRCKIKRVVNLDQDKCEVELVPHRDLLEPFTNPSLTRNYMRNIHNLFDMCNLAEVTYREQNGETQIAEAIKLRPPLDKRVDEMIYDLDNPGELEIAEWLSFCAMDHHFDPKTRCWALELQDTETRLGVVHSILQEKLRLIKQQIKAVNSGISLNT